MPKPIDVYLLAGQSNMEGYGFTNDLPEVLQQPHASVRLWWATALPEEDPGDTDPQHPPYQRWVPLAPGSGTTVGAQSRFGPELSFLHTLAAQQDTPIAAIKAAWGGTSLFQHWRPADQTDAGTLTNQTLIRSRSAMDALRQDGWQPRMRGVFWAQGESDTDRANPTPERHADRLRTLIQRVREELGDGVPVPWVLARMNPTPNADRIHVDLMRQATTAVADADPAAAWLDIDDLPFIEDGIHLGSAAQLTLGDRAAAAMLNLPAPPEPASQPTAKPDPSPEEEPPQAQQSDAPQGSDAHSTQSDASAPTTDPAPRSPNAEPEAEAQATPAAHTNEGAPKAADSNKPAPKTTGRAIALMNQKGGVGKTTTCVNLAAALAEPYGGSHKVLLIDLDPQAHLTLSLGIDPDALEVTAYDLLAEPSVTAEQVAVTPEAWPNLTVIPAETNLAGVEPELAEQVRTGLAQTILRNKCKPLVDTHDVVLIDCPPALNLLTINALTLATEVLVPMQAHFLALQGLTKLLETVSMVRQGINPSLQVAGVVLCMHEAHTLLAGEVIGELEGFFEAARGTDQPWANAQVYQPPVRRNIKLAEAPSFGQPVLGYAPDSNGAKDYRKLARSLAGG